MLFLFLQGGEKLGYETEAFAVYDVMKYRPFWNLSFHFFARARHVKHVML